MNENSNECPCKTGGEWSGSPSESHPDTHWTCDECGAEHEAESNS